MHAARRTLLSVCAAALLAPTFGGLLPGPGQVVLATGPDRSDLPRHPRQLVVLAEPASALVDPLRASRSRSQAPAQPETSTPQQYARTLLAQLGQGPEFGCLTRLWDRESGWSTTARSRTSGAYGIPQALPGSKMASAGADWLTNPLTQVRWGVAYISDRYGSPCSALQHSLGDGWY